MASKVIAAEVAMFNNFVWIISGPSRRKFVGRRRDQVNFTECPEYADVCTVGRQTYVAKGPEIIPNKIVEHCDLRRNHLARIKFHPKPEGLART